MRTTIALLIAAVACGDEAEEVEGCGPQPLDTWCSWPAPDGGCAPPPLDAPLPCGRYDVSTDGPGTTTTTHYFLDGEHVATVFGTDVEEYCGSYDLWFGEPIDCTIEWPSTGT